MNVQRTVLTTALAVCLVSTLLGVAMVNAEPEQKVNQPAQPCLIAVRYHADWCKACCTLAPCFDELQASMQDEAVLFVTLDFSDDRSKKQAEYLAAALGLNEIWRSNGIKTGQVLIIDAQKKEVVQTLLATDDVKRMRAKLTELLPTS